MRIVVASEEESLRASVAMLIDAQDDLEVVGDVSNFAELLAKTKLRRPELIVLDWDALGDRVELLFQLFEFINEEPPEIIALSVNEAARDEILASGISGFVYKGNPPAGLLEAIRESSARGEDSS
jgi:DNA-binding NarL/FixJ family response regulator